jgi:flagellar biosynthesis/type III secretory pathway M-ring protein FliF/YscJ
VSLVVAILTLVLLAVVLLVVSAPLRTAQRRRRENGYSPAEPDTGGGDLERDELEAAREAKYREIRDAELDYRTGKLSREDYESIDRALRAEALEILNRLETSAG